MVERWGVAFSVIILLGSYRRHREFVHQTGILMSSRHKPSGPHRRHIVQPGNPAIDLADHVLRERPEVQVQCHQHHDVTQRSWIGLGCLEGLPERLANVR
jgi:hypothetical protein